MGCFITHITQVIVLKNSAPALLAIKQSVCTTYFLCIEQWVICKQSEHFALEVWSWLSPHTRGDRLQDIKSQSSDSQRRLLVADPIPTVFVSVDIPDLYGPFRWMFLTDTSIFFITLTWLVYWAIKNFAVLTPVLLSMYFGGGGVIRRPHCGQHLHSQMCPSWRANIFLKQSCSQFHPQSPSGPWSSQGWKMAWRVCVVFNVPPPFKVSTALASLHLLGIFVHRPGPKCQTLLSKLLPLLDPHKLLQLLWGKLVEHKGHGPPPARLRTLIYSCFHGNYLLGLC